MAEEPSSKADHHRCLHWGFVLPHGGEFRGSNQTYVSCKDIGGAYCFWVIYIFCLKKEYLCLKKNSVYVYVCVGVYIKDH